MSKLLFSVLMLLPMVGFGQTRFILKSGEYVKGLEPAWVLVNAHLGPYTPSLITIEVRPSEPSMFNLPDQIIISERAWNQRRLAIVAHETAHLAIGAKTLGVSATNSFRFIDEGYASLIEEELKGTLEGFRKQAWCESREQLEMNNLSFALLQNWEEYFRSDWNWYAYDVGASFILFVQSRYSVNRFLELLDEIGKTAQLDISIANVFGLSLKEFEVRWIKAIREEAANFDCLFKSGSGG